MAFPNTFANVSTATGAQLDANFNALSANNGSSLVGFLQSGTGAVARTVQAKLQESVSVKDFGAVGNGIADDTAAIQAAINFASTTGGEVLFLPGTYIQSSSITLASGVILKGYGATLQWNGAAAVQITSPSSGSLNYAGIVGLSLNGGSTATKLIELKSSYHGVFRDLNLTTTNTSAYALDLLVNTSGTTNPDGQYNTVFNKFDNIRIDGTPGVGVRLMGLSSPTLAVVTLNTFSNLNIQNIYTYGIEFNSWCDTNYFSGVTRIMLASVTNANSIGVVWNTLTPAGNVGVYQDSFDELAVDTFGTPTGDARIGAKMNSTWNNKIAMFEQGPTAAGGDFVTTSNTLSYEITRSIGTGSALSRQTLGMNNSIGAPYSPSYSIYTGSFSLTGTNLSSATFADTFITSTSATGVTINNAAAAGATITTYYGLHIGSPTLGAGASIGNDIGFKVEDLTTGTNNYGIVSAVSSGAGKWNIFSQGTANSAFAGSVRFGGLTVPVATVDVTGSIAATTTNTRASDITLATGRAVQNTAAQATATIAAGIASTYIATPAANITVTLAAPTVDGERRRIVFGAATTVTWSVTTPATATAIKTSFAAGEAIEIVYNSVAGTPTNSAATTWYTY